MQVVHAMPMNREISSGRGQVRAAGPGARSIAAMKRAEAQLHSERARIGEDLEEAQERLAAEVAAQVRSAARLGQGPRYKRYRDASSGVRGMQTLALAGLAGTGEAMRMPQRTAVASSCVLV